MVVLPPCQVAEWAVKQAAAHEDIVQVNNRAEEAEGLISIVNVVVAARKKQIRSDKMR